MKEIVDFIKSLYPDQSEIPLHAPVFLGKEKDYVLETIESTFVSSVGSFVNRFEQMICDYTGAKRAVAVVNGTSALHIALIVAGVRPGDLLLTQAFTFVATSNAIRYTRAEPVFLDIDRDTLSLSPDSLIKYLENNTYKDPKSGETIDYESNRPVKACVPMHAFGMPGRIDEIIEVCENFGITVIEDAAESLGSTYKGKHTGTFGLMGIYSFNGNKTITAGGGGIIVTNDDEMADLAKHLTTQAKLSHPWEYRHDQIGYNYRCPNLNSALACAQLEEIEKIIENKRDTHKKYYDFFNDKKYNIVSEPNECRSNCWLNSVIFTSKIERDRFLSLSNKHGVITRPAWNLLNTLPMYENCIHDGLENSIDIQERLVNLPSSYRKI